MKRVRITSLVGEFLRVDALIREQKTSASRFRIWKRDFEQPYRDVFSVYYQWANRRTTSRTFTKYTKNYARERIERLERYARANLEMLATKLDRIISFSYTIPVMLFVGLKQSNGFVIKYKERYTTFLNLESYPDAYTLKMFMLHELAHNVHLRMGQGYYWKSKKMNWYTTMLLEGVATYITGKALRVNSAEAMWGNYLTAADKKRFMQWCERHESWLKRKLLREIGSTAMTESAFFGGRKPKGCPYTRTGYWLGLKFVESLLEEMSLKDVMTLKGQMLRKRVKEFLKE